MSDPVWKKTPNEIRMETEPTPPLLFSRQAEHHWLEKLDIDGHSFGFIVLQWNPGAKRWSHSGDVGADIYVRTHGWRYVAHCPMNWKD